MRKIVVAVMLLLLVVLCLSQSVSYVASTRIRKSSDYYFGIPIPGIDSLTKEEFLIGESLFNHLFSNEDNIKTGFNGLSCAGCHNTPVPGGSGIYKTTFVPLIVLNDSTEIPLQRFFFDDNKIVKKELPNDYVIRKTPALFGLGLLENIDNDIIKSAADPYDLNKDNISGRISYPYDDREDIGKFGWKGSTTSIKNFVNNALVREIGVSGTNKLESTNGHTYETLAYFISQYLTYLSPPYNIKEVICSNNPGFSLFNRIGCNKCHLTDATTKSADKILDKIKFTPFTDLLLHDLTISSIPKYAGYPSTTEYKTPSLVGLNSTGPPYMHNGSAATIEGAINLHNGEGIGSKTGFISLSKIEKETLLAFLKQL